jgi:hypothetical protein
MQSLNWLKRTLKPTTRKLCQIFVSTTLAASMATVILRVPLLSSGMIEFGDLLFHMDIEWAKARYFSTWNPYFGGDNGQWLGHFIWFSWLMQLGDSQLVERLLLFVTLTFLGLSAFNVTFAFAKRIFQKQSSIYAASIAATFIALMNPWTTTRLSQPPYIWMVASSFLLFYFTDKAVHERNKRNVIMSVIPASFALVLGGVIFYSLFYLSVFTVLLVFLEIIFASQKFKIKLLNGALFLSGLSLFSLLLFSFYLLPSLFALMPKYAEGVPWRVENTLFQMREVWRNSRMENVFRLSGHWVIGVEFYTGNEASNDLWFLSTLVFPIVALAALWLKPREKLVLMANIVAIVFLLLASLPSEPLRPLFLWLIGRSSLVLDILRETDRFSGALITAYAIMGGVAVGTIFHRAKTKRRDSIFVNKKIRFSRLMKRMALIGVMPSLVIYSLSSGKLNNLQQIVSPFIFAYVFLAGITALRRRFRKVRRETIGTVVLVVVCGSAVFSAYPLLSGNLAGYFQPIDLPVEYKHANEWLKAQKDDTLVLWLPPASEYQWTPHRLVPELRYWVTSKSTFIASVPPYKRYFENFIYDTLLFNRTSHIGKILSLANIGYILYHNDSIDASKHNVVFESLLSQQDVSLVFSENSIYIFKNNWEQKRLRAVNKTLLVVGGLDALIPLLDFEFFKPDDFAIFFLDQKPFPKQMLGEITQLPSTLLIYGNKNFTDVVLNTIGDEYYYAPYDYFTPLDDPWRADMMYSWLGPRAAFNLYPKGPRYDFDLEKKFIFTVEKNATFNFTINVMENDEYEIWIRIFLSPRGGKISLHIDEKETFSVLTRSPDQTTLQGFKWTKIGSLFLTKGSHNVSIVNDYGLTWVNVIAVVPSNQVQRHADYIFNLLSENNVNVIYLQDDFSLMSLYDFRRILEDSSFSSDTWLAEAGKWEEDRLVGTLEQVEWEVVDGILHSISPPYLRFMYVENLTLFDGVVEAAIKVDSNGTAPYIGFRAQDLSNLYIFGFAPWMQMLELSKFVNGKQTRLSFSSNFPVEVDKWYRLKVEFKDETIRCFVDDQLIFEATDTTFVAGTVGFWVYNLDAYLKDFKVIASATSVVFDQRPYSRAEIMLHLKPSKNYESIVVTSVEDKDFHMEFLNSTGWRTLKSPNFNSGQKIEVLLVVPHTVDKIILYSSNRNNSLTTLNQLLASSYMPEITTFQKLSPVKYNLEANVSSPYILILMELHDDLWQGLSREGSLAKISIPVYSAYNAFLVEEPESSSIKLIYTAEEYFRSGVLVTVFTVVFSFCLYLMLSADIFRKHLKLLLIAKWLKKGQLSLKDKR